MPNSTQGYDEPGHGKKHCDSNGGRGKKKLNLIRADDKLPSPETAEEVAAVMNQPEHAAAATAALYGKTGGSQRRVARFSRDRKHVTTAAEIEAVNASRGAGIKLPGCTKRMRELVYSANPPRLGWRPLQCNCAPCFAKDFDGCNAHGFVPSVKWFSEHDGSDWLPINEAAGIADVEPEELDRELEVAVGSTLDAKLVVAVEPLHGEWDKHQYFMILITRKPRVLKKAYKDAYNNEFKPGDVVFEGRYLEECDDDFGPGLYNPDSKKVTALVSSVIGIDYSELPPRVCPVTLSETEVHGIAWLELTKDAHDVIMARIGGETVVQRLEPLADSSFGRKRTRRGAGERGPAAL
jgi:hypothetical protein